MKRLTIVAALALTACSQNQHADHNTHARNAVPASGSAELQTQIAAVREVLEEIGAGAVSELLVFNKTDVTTEGKRLVEQHPGSLAISAVTGDGVEQLLAVLGDRLRAMSTVVELVVPYERGDVLAALHRDGEVLVEQHEDGGTRVRARLDAAPRNRYQEFVVAS